MNVQFCVFDFLTRNIIWKLHISSKLPILKRNDSFQNITVTYVFFIKKHKAVWILE